MCIGSTTKGTEQRLDLPLVSRRPITLKLPSMVPKFTYCGGRPDRPFDAQYEHLDSEDTCEGCDPSNPSDSEEISDDLAKALSPPSRRIGELSGLSREELCERVNESVPFHATEPGAPAPMHHQPLSI